MHDFDQLVAEVLRTKPEMTKDSLIALVQEKKRTVGSGYLTDQGALFLVSGELGVSLQHMVSTDLALKDIQLGANDITVVARVLAAYPVSEFEKKDGSGKGRYRRVNLFDRNSVVRLTIWEDNEEAMALHGITADTAVRVVSAYVRPGYLDGKPTLNLGKRGRMELVTDPVTLSKLAPISSFTKEPGSIKEGESVIGVEGLAVSESRGSTFVRRDDNSTGSLTQFELKGKDGKTVRVVIWDAGELPAVKPGSHVRVVGLRAKRGRQGEIELHGDSASSVILDEGGRAEPKERPVKVAEVAKQGATGPVSLEVMALSNGSAREVSLKDRSTARKGEVVLGDDTGEITAVSWNESSKMIEGIKAGETLRVSGATVQVSKMGVATLELGASSRLERLQASR
jgi:ssDNA-binding replication factor A large subunit